MFGKGTPDTGDTTAPIEGGAQDVTTTTASEAATNAVTEVSSSSGSALESLAQSGGSSAGEYVGQNIGQNVSTGTDVLDLDSTFGAVNAQADLVGFVNREALLDALITGAITSVAAVNWAEEFRRDFSEDALINKMEVAIKLNDTALFYNEATSAFNQARDLLAFSTTLADVGFGITSKVGTSLAAGSRIGIQGANAVGRQVGIFSKGLSRQFSGLSGAAKAEISLATVDGISIAAGGVAREAVKEAFVIEIRRQTAQQIVQQGIKETTISNIIKTTTKELIKR